MTAEVQLLALLILISITMTLLLTPHFITAFRQGADYLTALNFEGERIVTAGGLVLLPSVLLAVIFFAETIAAPLLVLLFIVGVTMLGLVDDFKGDKNCKGFRGHFLLLWQEKRISTGLMKAVTGFVLALLVAAGLGGIFDLTWLARGAVMALFANFFNLLDTRPARAAKVFFILSLPLIIIGSGEFIILILWASLYIYLPFELSHKIMLGDTGAYLLGGMLGYFVVVSFSSTMLYSSLFILLVLHFLLEKYSLSSILERGMPRIND